MKIQKLTNSEIAKVFAMYADCKTIVSAGNDNRYVLCGFNYTQPILYSLDGEKQFFFNYKECKLHLAALGKITDEHAIELANGVFDIIYYLGQGATKKDIKTVTKSMIKANYLKNVNPFIDAISGKPGCGWYEGSAEKLLFAREYLISKGYAVPLWFGIDHWANGQTAIQLGIAIESGLAIAKPSLK